MRTTHRYGLLVAAAGALGCGGLEPVAPYSPVTDPAQLFLSLEIDHAAVNLATVDGYRELQLVATPLNANGEPISGLPAPTFRSSDTTRVWVTPTGLLQARRGATAVQVIAEVVASGNNRRADTVLVNVRQTTTAPQLLDALELESVTSENGTMAMIPTAGLAGRIQLQFGAGIFLTPGMTLRALDTAGVAIPSLVVEYESLNPEVLFVNPRFGSLGLIAPGEAAVVVRTTAYGVSRADTTRLTVTLPLVHGVVVTEDADGGPPSVAPRTINIVPGGYAFFTNQTDDPISVTFENPAAAGRISLLCDAIGADWPMMCDSGDIPSFSDGGVTAFPDRFYLFSRGRQFTQPGSYAYRIEPLGVTGTIIVSDEAQ